MHSRDTSRRTFLASSVHSLGGAWLALHLPDIQAAGAYAREALRTGAPLATLTAQEARVVTAMAERILPSDDGPGAREAAVTPFMDRALGSFFGFMLEPVRDGVRDLDDRARRAHGGAPFADLPADAQDALLRDIETTQF
ncbi:MAG: gluconate 2-dehydrogenase subunit 3 family protein, partial [Longimicrobiales bacterium]